eukprot:1148345-Pelagomonas_calceolata.AAC.2
MMKHDGARGKQLCCSRSVNDIEVDGDDDDDDGDDDDGVPCTSAARTSRCVSHCFHVCCAGACSISAGSQGRKLGKHASHVDALPCHAH